MPTRPNDERPTMRMVNLLSQTEDVEPERGGSAGLDLIIGENAAQTDGLHGR